MDDRRGLESVEHQLFGLGFEAVRNSARYVNGVPWTDGDILTLDGHDAVAGNDQDKRVRFAMDVRLQYLSGCHRHVFAANRIEGSARQDPAQLHSFDGVHWTLIHV